MYDCTNIGSPVVLVFAGGAGGIAYALHVEHPNHPQLHFQLNCSEASEQLKMFPFIKKNIFILLFSAWNRLYNQNAPYWQ
jgi:hypothetical protein